MILLGTSGYSYPDWYGVFYPPGLERAKQLDFYVRQFKTVEVNSTYYRIPPPSTFAAMERKTPADFEFVVKAHSEMTHKQTRDPEVYEAFQAAMAPLRTARKLSGVLAQFPQSFHRSDDHEQFLVEMQERLEGAPLFVEFRHNSWMKEDVFEFLERASLGYVSVDEPSLPGLLPPVARATGALAYVRFHGRNAKSWYSGDEGGGKGAGTGGAGTRGAGARDAGTRDSTPARPARDRQLLRYDYLYSEAELKEWADKIRDLNQKTQKTFVFFNNCHAGQAATSAKLMRTLLGMAEPNVAEQTGLL
ncbi:MAG TPA: DUF72 domain-containing protein [Candidatus Eisenbacteria bacterium]|jgi:uncharacterized protein YecE (DUF72 family)